MLVISRNTAFTYKGKSVNPKQIGRELEVRYVLEMRAMGGGPTIVDNCRMAP
jgi:TolB-like protein